MRTVWLIMTVMLAVAATGLGATLLGVAPWITN